MTASATTRLKLTNLRQYNKRLSCIPQSTMIHVLKHVESITQHRDRSLLEAGVASALFELVKAREVNLYKVQSEESGHFIERVTHVGQDGLRFNSEFEPGGDPVPVSSRPEMQACVEAAQIVRRHDEVGGVFVHCFPIRVERGVLGVLEVICAAPLVDDDLGTAEGFLGLYRNYLNLLDYSERDTLTGRAAQQAADLAVRLDCVVHRPAAVVDQLAGLLIEPALVIPALGPVVRAVGDGEIDGDFHRIESALNRLRTKTLAATGIALPVRAVFGKGLVFVP